MSPLLGNVQKMYASNKAVAAVYLGRQKVWPELEKPTLLPPVVDGLAIFLTGGSAVTDDNGWVTSWADLSGRSDNPTLFTHAGQGLRNDRTTPTGRKAIYDPWVQANWAKGTAARWNHKISTTAGHLFFVVGKQVSNQSCFHAIGTGDDSYWFNFLTGTPVFDNFGSSGRENSEVAPDMGVTYNDWYVGQTRAAQGSDRGFKVNRNVLYSGPYMYGGPAWSDNPSFFEAKNWSPGFNGECAAILWYDRVLTPTQELAVYNWLRDTYIDGPYNPDPEPEPEIPPVVPSVSLVQTATYYSTSATQWTNRITLTTPTQKGSTLVWVDGMGTHSAVADAYISRMNSSTPLSWQKLRAYYAVDGSKEAYVEMWVAFDADPVTWVESIRPDIGSTGYTVDRMGRLFEFSGDTGLENFQFKQDKGYSKVYGAGPFPNPVGKGLAITAVVSSPYREPTITLSAPYLSYPALGSYKPTGGFSMLIAVDMDAEGKISFPTWNVANAGTYWALAVGPKA